MKRAASLLVVMVLAFFCASCGDGNGDDEDIADDGSNVSVGDPRSFFYPVTAEISIRTTTLGEGTVALVSILDGDVPIASYSLTVQAPTIRADEFISGPSGVRIATRQLKLTPTGPAGGNVVFVGTVDRNGLRYDVQAVIAQW